MKQAVLGALICGAGALLAGVWLAYSMNAPVGGAGSGRSDVDSRDTGVVPSSPPDSPRPGRRPHILLITLDTLRADHLGCYGYFRDTSPNLDALAQESILFERAIAPMATTFPVHLSIMTGVLPLEHGFTSNTRLIDEVFVPTEALQTVAQKLKTLGYQTAAFVSAAPVRDSTGLGAGFDEYDQPAVDSWKLDGIRRAADTNQAVFAWLDRHARSRASGEPRASVRADVPAVSRPPTHGDSAGPPKAAPPLFVWIHYFDTHWPYDPPPPFDTKFKADEQLKTWLAERRITESIPDKWKTRTAADIHNAYDGEIAYLDAHLGALLTRWRQAGLWDDSIVIVAADHGEGLGQHDWPAHGRIFGEQIHVPLIVRLPWDEPRQPSRVPSILSLADVCPTVFELAGPPLDGLLASQATTTSVFAPRDFPHAAFTQRSDRDDSWEPGEKFALTMDQWRYYYLTEGDDQLFDLTADPFELHNVIAEHPELARLMEQRLIERIAAGRQVGARLAAQRPPRAHSGPDADMKRALEGLGYAEDDEEVDSQEDGQHNDNDP
ncbi:MAG: hypothetical protein C4547_04075 [Phycisphaerales bacterium]|nr:MAG: hypothetical protein C4547_04075 [Phycisphaerales bacterium]